MYRCESRFEHREDLVEHYSEAHKDLIAMGMSLTQDAETGQPKGIVKDTLLTSIITYAITNKEQFRVFQSDF